MRHCLTILILAVLWGCNNIEDASPSKRKTFIRFFESNRSEFAVGATEIDGSLVIVTNQIIGESFNSIVHYSDGYGNEVRGTRIMIPDFKATSFKVVNSILYVAGNRVVLNPSSENLFDLSVSSALVYRVNADFSLTSFEAKDDSESNKTDYFANSLSVDQSGNIVLIGSIQAATQLAKLRPFMQALDAQTLAPGWGAVYDALERDYVNCKSAHLTASGDIIWASSLLREVGDLSNTFLAIPLVKPQSTFANRDYFGETTDQKIITSDIQPGSGGYGVIGTFAKTNGTSANLFFLRVGYDGTIIEGSQRFFDGESVVNGESVDSNVSFSEDSGDAITATSDGGFILAGSMLTTVKRGKGERDILVIKISRNGDVQWQKIFGSEGDETVGNILETSDGHILLTGSNNLAGLSSAFLIKMDSKGSLKN
jgi:hypothetical protein